MTSKQFKIILEQVEEISHKMSKLEGMHHCHIHPIPNQMKQHH